MKCFNDECLDWWEDEDNQCKAYRNEVDLKKACRGYINLKKPLQGGEDTDEY